MVSLFFFIFERSTMESLPNNSEKARNEVKVESREVKRVAGPPAKIKNSFWKMFKNGVIPENMTMSDLIQNIVMPGICDGVFNIATNIINCWRSSVSSNSIYENLPRNSFIRSGIRTQSTNTPYNRISTSGVQTARPAERRASRVSDYENIFYEDCTIENEDGSKSFVGGVERANQVLMMLDTDLADYGCARVSQLLEHSSLPTSPNGSDYYWGWVNLDEARVEPKSGGAILRMPKAVMIDNN